MAKLITRRRLILLVAAALVALGLRHLMDRTVAGLDRDLDQALGRLPEVLGALVVLLIGYKLLRLSLRKPAESPGTAAASAPESPAASRSSSHSAPKRWHSCNVLDVRSDARRVWQFDAGSGSFALNRVQSARAGEPLPGNLVGKSWGAVFRPKLNVAWLAPENVEVLYSPA